MSFSSKVKNEICRYTDLSKEEAIAELSGIMKVSGTLGFGGEMKMNFRITTENPAIARLTFKLLKDHFKIHTKIFVKKSSSLKKNNIYLVMIDHEMGVKELLKEVGVLSEEDDTISLDYSIPKKIVVTDECKRVFIRGVFLGGGSISNPEKTYHLEFVTHHEEYAEELSELINSYGLNSEVIQRKSSYWKS